MTPKSSIIFHIINSSPFSVHTYIAIFLQSRPPACHVTGAEGAEAGNLSGVVQTDSEPNPNNSKPYPVWKNGSDSKCTTLTSNSKSYPVWKMGQIPSAPHSQKIPNPIQFGKWVRFQVHHTQTILNPIQFGDWVRFQVGHTGGQF